MKQAQRAITPRKAVNVSLDPSLLARARALKINLSATLEQALIQQIAKPPSAAHFCVVRCSLACLSI